MTCRNPNRFVTIINTHQDADPLFRINCAPFLNSWGAEHAPKKSMVCSHHHARRLLAFLTKAVIQTRYHATQKGVEPAWMMSSSPATSARPTQNVSEGILSGCECVRVCECVWEREKAIREHKNFKKALMTLLIWELGCFVPLLFTSLHQNGSCLELSDSRNGPHTHRELAARQSTILSNAIKSSTVCQRFVKLCYAINWWEKWES